MLILKILLFKAESSIVALLRINASSLHLETDRIRALHEDLRFFTTLVTHQLKENTEKDKLIFTRIFSVSIGVISIYNPILDIIITKDMVFKVSFCFLICLMKLSLRRQTSMRFITNSQGIIFQKIMH